MKVIPAKEFENYVGQETGVTEWLEITQERINQFADATNDHQFIHVDPEMAKATPWGTTIAHGFLTLSLLSYMSAQNGFMPDGLQMAINYGLTLGFSSSDLLIALLVTQFVAFPGTLFINKMSDLYSCEKAIIGCLVIYLIITFMAYSLHSVFEFYVIIVITTDP